MGIRTKDVGRYMKLAAALASLLLVGIFVSAALADGGSTASAPTVATDRAAYVPGDTVHVTGAGWLPNESVHVHAAADGHSFAYDADVVATVDGALDASFTLPSDYADTFAVALSSALEGSVSTSVSDAFAAASASAPATVVTDAGVYGPGATVTLTGNGWQPSEVVHLFVNDDQGQTWSYSADVTADPAGNFTHQFQLPNSFVAHYAVSATGSSGDSATAAFQDDSVVITFPTATSYSSTGWAAGCSPAGFCGTANGGNTAAVKLSLRQGTGNYWNGTSFANASETFLDPTTFTATGGNSFDWKLTFPFSSFTSGQYTLHVQGYSSNKNGLSPINNDEATVTFTIGNTPTTTALTRTTGSSPSVYGSALTFTATVTASPSNPSTGSVTFNDGATVLCNAIALTGNTATCSPTLAAGTHSLTATYNPGAGFATSTSSALSQSITAKPITGNFTASSKVYDATTAATVLTRTLSGVVGADDVSLTGGTASFADKNVGSGKTVTLFGAALSGAAAGNYTLSSVGTTTANITAKAVTGSFTANSKIYDGTNSATVSARSLTGAIGGDAVSLAGGSATFSDKNVATGKSVTLSGASLSGSDAGNYSLDSVSSASADITPKPVTGSFTAASRSYDGTTAATVLTRSLNGAIAGDTVTLSGGSATFSDKNIGTAKTVTLTGASLAGIDAPNYSLSSVSTTTADITPKQLTGAIAASNKVYDGNASATAVPFALVGVIGSEDVSLSVSNAHFADRNVGTSKSVTADIVLAGADKANYSLSSNTASTTADISALGVTGSFTTPASRGYDGTTGATVSTRSLHGAVAGDDVSLVGGAASFADKNVGVGKTVTLGGYSLAGADKGNYQLTSVSTEKADITALAITGSFTADDKVYDGTVAAVVHSRSLTGVVAGDDVSLVGGTASFADKNVGAGKTVTLSGAGLTGVDAGNYGLASVGTAKADITAKQLSGAIAASNKVYDGTAAAVVAPLALPGVIVPDVVSLTAGNGHFDSASAGTGKTVTADIALAGADAGNYVLLSLTASTTADITAKPLTGSFKSQDKVYDGSTDAAATDRALAGVVGGDSVSLVGGTASFADKNVGAGKTVTLSGAGLTGADAGNYSLDSVSTAKADIAAKPISGSFTAKDKVYDATVGATVDTTSLPGVVGGDTVSLVVTNAHFDNKNVGTGKDVTGALSLTGGDAVNYGLSSLTASTTAAISAKPVTGAFTANDKVYDGYAGATVKTKSLPGILGSDDATLVVASPRFDNKNVGTSKNVSGDLSLTGGDSGNYSLTSPTASTTANITAKAATGNFSASDKVYDGTTAATVINRSLNGIVGPDDVALSGGTATFASKNVGTNKAVTLTGASLSGSDAGNYTLTSVAQTTANITAKPIGGSFTAANKVYDGSTAATVITPSLAGVVGNDAVTLTGGTAAFDSKNVGTGKTVTLTGASLSGNDASNYSLTSVDTTKADITRVPLTVTADNQVMTLNGTVPPLTFKITGFVGNETTAVVSGTPSCTTADGKTIGTFDIVCTIGTLDAQNYSFPAGNFVKGKLTVFYRWDGFLQPINDTAHTGLLESKFKLGQTIPVKFNLKDAAGNVVQQAVNPTFTKTYVGASCGQTVSDSVDATVAPDPSTVYTWDGSQYHYNWSTKGLQAGEYRIYANLADGTKQPVNICLS